MSMDSKSSSQVYLGMEENSKHDRSILSKMDWLDGSELNWMKVDQIRPNWIEYSEMLRWCDSIRP